MSARGIIFLAKWIANKVPETMGSDIISVSELTEKLFADAKKVGISSNEIEEDTGSAYENIHCAIIHNDAGLAD